MANKLDIPLHGTSLGIVRRCGSPLTAVVESKFGCSVTIDGVDFVGQQKRTTTPEKRFTTTLRSGVELSVWKADLTDFKADAVVNAANERLQHYGGLARALSLAGGAQIQRESDDYVAKHGAVKTGDALVLNAGFLPYWKVIHAVGPSLFLNHSTSEFLEAERLLEKVIRSILDKVKESRLQSVAIPAISSGLFNYPLPQCAKTIVTCVRSYYEFVSSSGYLPKEVFLVNHDEPTVAEMEKACRQVFASGKGSGGAKTSATPVQLGNIRLTLKSGKIEEEKTDIIVNTTSITRDLKAGQISKALLEKAGPKMQDDIHRAQAEGHIYVTKGYKLHCKLVFHTFCPDKGTHAAQKILYKSISECLWMAAANKHSSISFPAIGTGALGFDKKESAQIMSKAVADFAGNSQKKMDVYFVIFPSDNNTFKAFEEQITSLKQKAFLPSFTQGDDSSSSRAPTPQISLTGPSNETTREAERWLTGLLFRPSSSVDIHNNFILHFGEKEHLQLSRLLKTGLCIEEFFEGGRASLTVSGESVEDVVVAGLQVEALLCSIQREFAAKEERFMLNAMLSKNLSYERKLVDSKSPEFSEISSGFKKHGLLVLKIDEVENPTLETLFELKRNQLECTAPARKMFQRIPAHFCEMVSHIGFHTEYAPPGEPAFGEGIYFAGKITTALELWKVPKQQEEEYLYFVVANVLTGKSAPGEPGLILPPAVGTDPLVTFDSVSGGPDVSVIFSGYQALPEHVITCKRA
ncbi:protein mono-ADP-ribosyltransferase PARP9 [Clinocottus analis]|uniref:protein mono-ADP-ribosyltransferase PARP9 n=1 Tax=Clinocottus analis TaxID=304258 RepID=UPI0035C1DF07